MGNTPAGTVNNIAIGNAIVYVGAEGVTPADDVGYLSDDGIELSYETETVDVSVGFPKTSVRQFVSAVTVSLKFTTMEWDLTTFNRALIGVLTTATTNEQLGVGLDACPGELTGKITFQMPCVNDTITIDMWRIQSSGKMTFKFDSNPHTFPYDFRVLLATETWAAVALPATESLFKVTRTIAP